MTKNRMHPADVGAPPAAPRRAERRAPLLASTSRPRRTPPARPTTDDLAIDALCADLKARATRDRELRQRRQWDDVRHYSIERLAQMLAEAVCLGDITEAAMVCSMLRARNGQQASIAEHARRSFLRGSREAAALAAEQWEQLARALHVIAREHGALVPDLPAHTTTQPSREENHG